MAIARHPATEAGVSANVDEGLPLSSALSQPGGDRLGRLMVYEAHSASARNSRRTASPKAVKNGPPNSTSPASRISRSAKWL